MKKGFTLIELLIVIALLGTLAVALLAAIDPFEQFRKGNDTGVRNTVQEVYNAAIRYYALKNAWPTGWTFGSSGTDQDIGTLGATVIIQPLINAGELKDNFIELAESQLSKIYLTKQTASVTDSHIAVCFNPESKSFTEADSNTKFTSPDYSSDYYGPVSDSGTTCAVNGGSDTNCYWCVY